MTPSSVPVSCGTYFNSHARVGRDEHLEIPYSTLQISTHTPAWGVTVLYSGFFYALLISTHTPAWGVTPDFRLYWWVYYISTHTPAWGVTFLLAIPRSLCSISTHTPAWGVTSFFVQYVEKSQNFNSHARVGRDLFLGIQIVNMLISTHTPAWGVT